MSNLIGIIGPMYSGKSSLLIQKAKISSIAKIKIAAFKPEIDNRYSEEDVLSHDEYSFEKATGVRPINLAIDLSNFDSSYIEPGTEEIYIDEIQFFNREKILNFVYTLIQTGFRVIFCGLDLDRFGNPFGAVPDLLCLADEVIKLKAVCFACHKPATKTYGKDCIKDGGTIVIGGIENYMALCNKCWFKTMMIKEFDTEYNIKNI